MFKYPIADANLEVIKYKIKDNKTFDAEVDTLTLHQGEMEILFDRPLTSLEEEEASGFVSGHVVEDFYTHGHFKVEEYSNNGRLQKVTVYHEKEEETYSGKVSEAIYYYPTGNNFSHYIEEKYDVAGNVYERIKYSVFSDTVSKQVMVEEEHV